MQRRASLWRWRPQNLPRDSAEPESFDLRRLRRSGPPCSGLPVIITQACALLVVSRVLIAPASQVLNDGVVATEPERLARAMRARRADAFLREPANVAVYSGSSS